MAPKALVLKDISMMVVLDTNIMVMAMSGHIPLMHTVEAQGQPMLSPHILLVCSSQLPAVAPGRLRLSLAI